MKVYLLMRRFVRSYYSSKECMGVYESGKEARAVAKEKSAKSRDYDYYVVTKTLKGATE